MRRPLDPSEPDPFIPSEFKIFKGTGATHFNKKKTHTFSYIGPFIFFIIIVKEYFT